MNGPTTEPLPGPGEGLRRVRLDLSYDGGAFSGWARQPGLRTVEGVVRDALSRVAGDPEVVVVCAGRTDAGVHARGQVCHADLDAELLDGRPGGDLETLRRRLAGVLPDDVRVRAVSAAPPGFDARFSALRRRYAYRLSDDPTGVDPLARGYVVAHPRPLDVAAMNRASSRLLGEHDFAAFCRRRDGASTVRELIRFDWRRTPSGSAVDDAGSATPRTFPPPGAAAGIDPQLPGEPFVAGVARNADPSGGGITPPDRNVPPAGIVVAEVVADAFCHSMVRALVGAVVPVGDGRRDESWPAEVLASRTRHPAVVVMPPRGLVLEQVEYPAEAQLAERQRETRRFRG